MTIVLETPRKNLALGFSYEDYLTFLEKAEEGQIEHKFQYFDGEIIPAHSGTHLYEWFVSYVCLAKISEINLLLLFLKYQHKIMT